MANHKRQLKLKRIATKYEPKEPHSYLIKVFTGNKCRYLTAYNKKGVRETIKNLKQADLVEVFVQTNNYVEGFVNGKY